MSFGGFFIVFVDKYFYSYREDQTCFAQLKNKLPKTFKSPSPISRIKKSHAEKKSFFFMSESQYSRHLFKD